MSNSTQTVFSMHPVDDLIPYARNARTHSPEQVARIAGSIKEFGFLNPVIISEDGGILAGHGRVLAAQKLGLKDVPCVIESHLTETQRRAYILADNRIALDAGWDNEMLRVELAELADLDVDLSSLGFDDAELNSALNDLQNAEQKQYKANSLAESFLIPPLSILDTTRAEWIARRKDWISLGISSECGRNDGLCYGDTTNCFGIRTFKSTSIFDPVLCELLVLWFSTKGSVVFDPFAGGSVRGIVSSYLGRNYTGIDLRKEQVDSNINQANAIDEIKDNMPKWIVGDSLKQDSLCPELNADLILTCPPYVDLERYSDNPDDLSTMKYPEFIRAYREIIKKSCSRLNENRFAAIVVGEVRDKKGHYHGFVKDTIDAFIDAGMQYYNELILVNQVGSLCITVAKQFNQSRKTGKRHQNVLIFLKGDAKKAAEYCGDIEIPEIIQDYETMLMDNT